MTIPDEKVNYKQSWNHPDSLTLTGLLRNGRTHPILLFPRQTALVQVKSSGLSLECDRWSPASDWSQYWPLIGQWHFVPSDANHFGGSSGDTGGGFSIWCWLISCNHRRLCLRAPASSITLSQSHWILTIIFRQIRSDHFTVRTIWININIWK